MSWDELEGRSRKRAAKPEPARQTMDEAGDDGRLAGLCALTFNTSAGRELMKRLRARTIERRTAPDMPESALRHLEGQRQFVRQLEEWTSEGERRNGGRTEPGSG